MHKKELLEWQQRYENSGADTSPVMLFDTEIALKNTALLRNLLPRVELFYAMKSFADAPLISKLKDSVNGFDVASWGEIQKLREWGVEPRHMVFSNPVKIPAHVENAYKIGVRQFAFDSVEEINKLARYAPGSDVYLRIRVSDYGSMFPLSKKFGGDPHHALAYASTALDLGLNFVGITFHVGSQSETAAVWTNALEVAGRTIKNLRNAGIDVSLLNIGGGFPASYANPVIPIEDLAKEINLALEKYIPNDLRLMAEPGRFISANAAVVVSKVIGKEHRAGSNWLYLDIGAFQGLIEPLETPDLKYPVFNMDSGDPANSATFVLTGPTCDAQDTLGLDYSLPSNTKLGDRIIIGSVGAYSLSYASYFNGFQPPKVIYVG